MKKTLARSITYDFLAKGFLYPDESIFNTFTDIGFEENLKDAVQIFPGPRKPFQLEKIEAGLGALKSIGMEGLLLEYERLFGIQSRRIKVVINQTEVIPRKPGLPILSKVHELSDLVGFYKAFAFKTEKIRPDHFGVELEFMHILTFKEFQAKKDENKNKEDICRNAERKFLLNYLGPSGLLFAKGLLHSTDNHYFKFLAETFLWFMAEETSLLNINLAPESEKKTEEPVIVGACMENMPSECASCL